MGMTTNELKEYLGMVVDMEKSIRLQDELIGKMERKIASLAIPRKYTKPAAPRRQAPRTSPVKEVLGGIALLVVAVVAVDFGIDLVTSGHLFYILLSLLVFAFGAAAGICGLFQIFGSRSEAKEAQEREMNDRLEYLQAQSEYRQNMAEEKARMDREWAQKTLLVAELQQLQKDNQVSRQVLNSIYEKNIIFPKYRNLVMVCSLYEYLCAGRCDRLEGHEGAYNILEMEIRMDRIITQLDRVIARLDAIAQNQYMLYSTLQETNNRCDQILLATERTAESLGGFHRDAAAIQAQISQLQKTSALAAYHAERVQKEMNYMNRMNYLTGRNDGVFFNAPPL